MPAATEANEVSRDRISSIARGLAKSRQEPNAGRGQAFMVRLNDAVLPLVEGAKAPGQSVVQYLKEAAVTVALQRLEDSQN